MILNASRAMPKIIKDNSTNIKKKLSYILLDRHICSILRAPLLNYEHLILDGNFKV